MRRQRRRIATAERRLREAAQARRERILAMREQGKTYEEIGKLEGVTRQRAWQLGQADEGEEQ